MKSNESPQSRRRSPREYSPQHSRAHAAKRGRRAVGATAISAPGANALGLSRQNTERAYGRGETARRAEASRKEYSETYTARPAVYTAENQKEGLFSRIHLPSLSMAGGLPLWLGIVLALIVAVVVVMGPARNYYLAWREAGVLQAQYAVVEAQNAELNHEIDRLQTLEGIEDEARARGYVYPDEEAVVVEGVEKQQVADPAQVNEAVEAYEKSLPWYVGVLDTLFGYTRS